MIDLANLEAWFVAGSQHLYGPETLKMSTSTPLQSRALYPHLRTSR